MSENQIGTVNVMNEITHSTDNSLEFQAERKYAITNITIFDLFEFDRLLYVIVVTYFHASLFLPNDFAHI